MTTELEKAVQALDEVALPIQTKAFEIRDEGTFIAIVAIKCDNRPLFRRDGLNENYIILVKLNTLKADYDVYWEGSRTMRTAHEYILRNWETLQDNQVIDVEYILGITKTPKDSEAGKWDSLR